MERFSMLDQRVVAEGSIFGTAGWFPCPGLGSAGPDLRAQGSSQEERLSRCARGMEWIASSACSGPVPLPPGLPAVANRPPNTPRCSLQAGNPGCSPATITGREDGWTPIAFPKFGNRSLTPFRSRPDERRRPAMMDAGGRLQAGPAAAGSGWRGSGWGKRSLDSIAGSVKAFP